MKDCGVSAARMKKQKMIIHNLSFFCFQFRYRMFKTVE